MSVTSLIGTARNNKKINDVAENFTYWEENENVSLTLKSGKEITIRFSEKSATVYQGYTANGKAESIEIVSFIRWYVEQKGYEVVQAYTDMYGEYRLHNLLYRLGYKREQTGDSDLDYERDKRWYVNAASKIIGRSGF
jgi:hypothetical protein